MIPVTLSENSQRLKTLLCLGAHSDDIEIGCGGTILKWLDQNRRLQVFWVVFTAAGEREREARQSAALFLKRAHRKQIIVQQFRESYFPYIGQEIKDFFEVLKQTISPDVVFTHYRADRHQDHRIISDLTWNTFRAHLILEYEIPKYDGDIGQTNGFVTISRGIARRKFRYLRSAFRSQRNKHWFSDDTFNAFMRIRGMECATAGLAEAFYIRKLSIQVSSGVK